jgi:hypothetical protein
MAVVALRRSAHASASMEGRIIRVARPTLAVSKRLSMDTTLFRRTSRSASIATATPMPQTDSSVIPRPCRSDVGSIPDNARYNSSSPPAMFVQHRRMVGRSCRNHAVGRLLSGKCWAQLLGTFSVWSRYGCTRVASVRSAFTWARDGSHGFALVWRGATATEPIQPSTPAHAPDLVYQSHSNKDN